MHSYGLGDGWGGEDASSVSDPSSASSSDVVECAYGGINPYTGECYPIT